MWPKVIGISTGSCQQQASTCIMVPKTHNDVIALFSMKHCATFTSIVGWGLCMGKGELKMVDITSIIFVCDILLKLSYIFHHNTYITEGIGDQYAHTNNKDQRRQCDVD